MQPQREFGDLHGFAREREQRMPAAGIFEDEVEESGIDLGIVADERQIRVNDGNHERPGQTACRDLVHQVCGDVRVRRQAVATPPAFIAHRDELHEHVQACEMHVARNVRVVQADVVALYLRHAEHRAGLQIEFVHADIRRQRARMQRCHIVQIGIVAAEMAFEEWTEEAPLEIALRMRPGQRQRRVQREFQRGVLFHARINGVQQHIRLAQSERRSDTQVASRVGENAFDAGIQSRQKFGRPRHDPLHPQSRIIAVRQAFSRRSKRNLRGLRRN